jgi:hypothetical protein
VQRPGALSTISKDLYVMRRGIGVYEQLVKRFTAQTTDYQQLLSTFAEGLYTEMDFRNEVRFVASCLLKRNVPKIGIARSSCVCKACRHTGVSTSCLSYQSRSIMGACVHLRAYMVHIEDNSVTTCTATASASRACTPLLLLLPGSECGQDEGCAVGG